MNHFLENYFQGSHVVFVAVLEAWVAVGLDAATACDVFAADGDENDVDCIRHLHHCTFPCLPFHPRGLSHDF
jgi:hypothetical protein